MKKIWHNNINTAFDKKENTYDLINIDQKFQFIK